MKKYIPFLKFMVLAVTVGLLFSFSAERNRARKLSKIEVIFLDDNDPFITLATVNKLLIQNHDSITGVGKETLVLKEMESRLLKNDMIRDAEVYVTVDGVLGAKIEQRKPVGRVAATTHYYLDEDGEKMPLSTVYAARVPIITGISNTNFTEITPLLLKIRDDEFMQQAVVGLEVSKMSIITLKLRKHDFDIVLGKLDAIEKKFQNFKAFYKKTKSDNTISSYKTISLQFGNQVVATKK